MVPPPAVGSLIRFKEKLSMAGAPPAALGVFGVVLGGCDGTLGALFGGRVGPVFLGSCEAGGTG